MLEILLRIDHYYRYTSVTTLRNIRSQAHKKRYLLSLTIPYPVYVVYSDYTSRRHFICSTFLEYTTVYKYRKVLVAAMRTITALSLTV